MIRFILNLLWFFLNGWAFGLAWLIYALLAAITIVGLPWARSCFNIAIYGFWPLGRQPVNREDLTGREDMGTGIFGMLGNILWFVFAGLWLAIGHLTAGIAFCITIIGIPFGYIHFKLARASLFPVGMMIVDKDELI
jgi:uncharacterized membrane protein YccF (DUF307 family)